MTTHPGHQVADESVTRPSLAGTGVQSRSLLMTALALLAAGTAITVLGAAARRRRDGEHRR